MMEEILLSLLVLRTKPR